MAFTLAGPVAYNIKQDDGERERIRALVNGDDSDEKDTSRSPEVRQENPWKYSENMEASATKLQAQSESQFVFNQDLAPEPELKHFGPENQLKKSDLEIITSDFIFTKDMFPDIFQRPGASCFEEKVKSMIEWANLWIHRRQEKPVIKIMKGSNKFKNMPIYEAFNKLSNKQLGAWTDIQQTLLKPVLPTEGMMKIHDDVNSLNNAMCKTNTTVLTESTSENFLRLGEKLIVREPAAARESPNSNKQYSKKEKQLYTPLTLKDQADTFNKCAPNKEQETNICLLSSIQKDSVAETDNKGIINDDTKERNLKVRADDSKWFKRNIKKIQPDIDELTMFEVLQNIESPIEVRINQIISNTHNFQF